jgi:hypothetical protein
MKTIASVALALACASVMAQSPAPTDVPQNHWAYPAVTNLYRLGILKGYPDGTFKGSRPATRFEMATALNAAFTDLKNITDGLGNQLDQRRTSITGDYASLADFAALRRDLDTLRTDVASVRATKTEVDGLKDDFQSLNEQLRAIRASLTESRAKLEKTKH